MSIHNEIERIRVNLHRDQPDTVGAVADILDLLDRIHGGQVPEPLPRKPSAIDDLLKNFVAAHKTKTPT